MSGLLVWLAVFGVAAVRADDKATLQSVQQDIASKEQAVREQQRQRGSLLSQLKSQEQKIAAVSARLRDMQAELTALGQQITSLNASVGELENQQKKEKRQLAGQLDAAFRMGRHGGLAALLMGERGQREQRLQAYYDYLNQAREQVIDDLRQTERQLGQRKQTLESRRRSQQSLLAQQQAQQKQLEQARDARRKTVKQLDASIAKGQQQLVELRQNEARLQESIARAEAAAREQTQREARQAQQVRERQQAAGQSGKPWRPDASEQALMARTGGLGPPRGQDLRPVRGALLHRYGDIIQGELRWKGIVIAAPVGTDVSAIADGRVILMDWLQGYGLVIVLEHGKGDMSLYGYNETALVKTGQLVKAGQPIARVGDSGGQGRSALYFEIRRQGQAVNPLPWLKE